MVGNSLQFVHSPNKPFKLNSFSIVANGPIKLTLIVPILLSGWV